MDVCERAPEEVSDDDSETGEEINDDSFNVLSISQAEADKNYNMAGSEVPEPPDQINVMRYQHLMLNDTVHSAIMEVLDETRIKFKLADFQLVSLHVLGSQRNLILISPTGSGKMLGKRMMFLQIIFSLLIIFLITLDFI